MATRKSINKDQSSDGLLKTLEQRFEKNMNRHKGLVWKKVSEKLMKNPSKIQSLDYMEETGGEPDVIGYDKKNNSYIFCDCSAESPSGRRSICYDKEGLDSRKEHKPGGSAIEMAAQMGIEITSEEQYRYLQTLGKFDLKTSSWILTPNEIRKLGGALFCDRRYNSVFTYHNGAQSYYGARGFRGILIV